MQGYNEEPKLSWDSLVMIAVVPRQGGEGCYVGASKRDRRDQVS
jgi:hypothetical protein